MEIVFQSVPDVVTSRAKRTSKELTGESSVSLTSGRIATSSVGQLSQSKSPKEQTTFQQLPSTPGGATSSVGDSGSKENETIREKSESQIPTPQPSKTEEADQVQTPLPVAELKVTTPSKPDASEKKATKPYTPVSKPSAKSSESEDEAATADEDAAKEKGRDDEETTPDTESTSKSKASGGKPSQKQGSTKKTKTKEGKTKKTFFKKGEAKKTESTEESDAIPSVEEEQEKIEEEEEREEEEVQQELQQELREKLGWYSIHVSCYSIEAILHTYTNVIL